jgi:PAS domain S-box-containing protein
MRFDGSEAQLNMLRELAESLTDPVFLVDKAFNVWYSNRAFEQAAGVRMGSKKFKDAPCYELLGLDICKNNCVMKQAVAAQRNVRLAEIAGLNAGGEKKNFHINAIPLENNHGTAFGALIFLRDVTAETQVHEKYKQLVAKNSNIALSGTIEAGNLIDVLQLFIFLQKTGELELSQNQSEHRGYVFFESGQIVGVIALENGARTEGEKAFDRLLGWQAGAFSFHLQRTLEPQQRISGSTDFMLMDAVRERDELTTHKPLDRTITLRLEREPVETDELNSIQRIVADKVRTPMSVALLLGTTPHSDSRIVNAVHQLREKGIVAW